MSDADKLTGVEWLRVAGWLTTPMGWAKNWSGPVALALLVAGSWVPKPLPVPGPMPTVDPALVIVVDKDGVRVDDAAVEAAATRLTVGSWRVVAVPKPGQKGWERTVLVSDVGPQPVPPGPTPPTPVPPQPTPTPEPSDPFFATLRNAYQLEPVATRAANAANLAALYRQGAKETVMKPDIQNVGKLLEVMKVAAKNLVGDNLVGVRTAISIELRATLPKAPETALDPATRDAIAHQFNRMAAMLEVLK